MINLVMGYGFWAYLFFAFFWIAHRNDEKPIPMRKMLAESEE